MARSSLKVNAVRACFQAATDISDAEAKRLADLAAQYSTGDERQDYVAALTDRIAQLQEHLAQVDAAIEASRPPAPPPQR